MRDPVSVAIVTTQPAVRARLRALLASAGFRVLDEPEGADDGDGVESPDALVIHDEGSGGDHAVESLTPREREVLAWLAEGLPNKAIAARLGISEHTVKFHVASIYGKLDASTRAEAVRRGLRRGLIAL